MKKKSNGKKNKQKLKIDSISWNTSDEDEIIRRKIRAESEKYRIINQQPLLPYFSLYHVISVNKKYFVEIRSLNQLINSCDCHDYRTNALGTCKHIEAVLLAIKKKGIKKFKQAEEEGSQQIEIFLDSTRDPTIRVLWPKKTTPSIKKLVEPFFSSNGNLLDHSATAYDNLTKKLKKNNAKQTPVRISQHIQYFIDYQMINSQKQLAKDCFLEDVDLGKRSLNFLKHKLLPYQQEGMLHLAFTERALLADEMGLGKTVQAIAACELLRQLHDIKRILVIAPASLKSEWEEQIAKFTDLSSIVIMGSRAKRLQQYKQNHYFYLMNYEQVMVDYDEIQQILAPDIIILDEAQRIKNWRTKTANVVKELKSRYAFVLTGTPVENRIDDIYSIIQFLDPHVFGSLFRFNRDFYQFDEEGRPSGYKNLNELYRRLRSIMLCRKKADVEEELPKRLNNNYFVSMESEQRVRYEEYEIKVSRLVNQSKKRPLRKEEFELLQKWLACMRMLCDSPFILDQECRISPKLIELQPILEELLAEPTTKIIIFSEWERMLQLVKEMADDNNWEAAWHTGTVPQQKRRQNINRFKRDENCRIFLSTDSGSVGLNLQVANVVINLDLPWNPAKLEQRIARAWRKYQLRLVQVINLICENSIEHRMLYLLEKKQLMAQSILTGDETLSSMKMPSGRAAFMERMEALMISSEENNYATQENMRHVLQQRKEEDINAVKNSMIDAFGDTLHLLQTYPTHNSQSQLILAVVDGDSETVQEQVLSVTKDASISLETIDKSTLAIIQRLANAGILTVNTPLEILHEQDAIKINKQRLEKQLDQASHYISQAERKQRMVKVLIESDFSDEAIISLHEAFMHSMKGFLYLTNQQADKALSLAEIESLTIEHCGPIMMPALFTELTEFKNKTSDVKQLHYQHQLALDHLYQMKDDLVAQI